MKRQTLILVVIGVILFIAGSAIAYASVKGASKHGAGTQCGRAGHHFGCGREGQHSSRDHGSVHDLEQSRRHRVDPDQVLFTPLDLGSLTGLTDEVLTQAVTKGHAIAATELKASTSSISVPTGLDAVTVTISGTNASPAIYSPAPTLTSTQISPRSPQRAGVTRRSRCPVRSWRWRTSKSSTCRAPSPSFASHETCGRPDHSGHRDAAPGRQPVGRQEHRVPLPERVPVGRADPAGCQSATSAAVHRHGPDDGSTVISRRILVISRSPALSRAIQASLGPGYQVLTSANVSDVVDEVQEQGPFDVLVAGPVFDSHAGMARLAALRAAEPFPPSCWPSARSRRPTWATSSAPGAVDLVEYPTSKRQLAAALKRAFDIADVSASDNDPTLPVVAARASSSTGLSSPRSSRWRRRAAGAARRSTPPTWPATWRRRRDSGSAWSISTCNSARSRRRCTSDRGSRSRTCCLENRWTRTISTSTSRSTSRSTSSGFRSWPRLSARLTPT